jgi:hypothetical protein
MRTRHSTTFGVAVLFLTVFIGCSGGGGETDGGPASAVRTFYDHLNAGRYADAKALYLDEVRAQIFPDESADEGFRNWATVETHNRTLTDFNVVSETEAETGITLEFELLFKSGEKSSRRVVVAEENGAWRLGFIG